MAKSAQPEMTLEEYQSRAICCGKCGTGVNLHNGIVPEHRVMASHQGSKARICKETGEYVK